MLSKINQLLPQKRPFTPKSSRLIGTSSKGDFSPIQFKITLAKIAPFRGLGVKNIFILIVILNLLSVSVNAQVRNPILPGFYPDPSIAGLAAIITW